MMNIIVVEFIDFKREYDMKVTRKLLRRLIIKEFLDTSHGRGQPNYYQAYKMMQKKLIPLLVEYFQTDGSNYDQLESFVSYDNYLWKIICAGPAPTGDEFDSNTELPDMFLSCLIDEPGGALMTALYRTDEDGIPLDVKIKNFVNSMRTQNQITGEVADFLEYVSHSWVRFDENVTDKFAKVILGMIGKNLDWPILFR